MMDILNYSLNYKDNKSFKLFKTLCETYGDVVVENDYLTVTFKDGSEAKFGLKTNDIILKNFLISEHNKAIIILDAYNDILKMIEANQDLKDMTLVKTDDKEFFIDKLNGILVNDDVFLPRNSDYSYNYLRAELYQPAEGGAIFAYDYAYMEQFNTGLEHVIEAPEVSRCSYETQYDNVKINPHDNVKFAAIDGNSYYIICDSVYLTINEWSPASMILLDPGIIGRLALYGDNGKEYPVLIKDYCDFEPSAIMLIDTEHQENFSYIHFEFDSEYNHNWLNAYEVTYNSYNYVRPQLIAFDRDTPI